MDISPAKNIYIKFNGKQRRYSGLVEQSPDLKVKRKKSVDLNNEDILNSAFREDEPTNSAENSCYSSKVSVRRKRRLSGLYKRDLNTGFIEESPPKIEKKPTQTKHTTLDEDSAIEEERTIGFDNKEKCVRRNRQGTRIHTPVKSKLRNNKVQQAPTEKEIIKYYTDKSVKKKQNTLETIFEVPRANMLTSVKKFKRFINFNERNSNVKVRKRQLKREKCGLWKNYENSRVSMEYFVQKFEKNDHQNDNL